MVAAGAAGRLLMHGHHVGKGLVEEPVVFLEQALEAARERNVVRLIEVGQSATMLERRQVDLIGPARKGGDEGDPALVAQHGPRSVFLSVDDVAVKAPPGLAHLSRPAASSRTSTGGTDGHP